MAWPKGKPRKTREEGPAEAPTMELVEKTPEPKQGAFKPAVGPKREGGKDALAAQNIELERQQEPTEKSEREKIGDKYMEQTYGTPEGELSQKVEETPPTSEEELSPEKPEEVAPEEEQQELQPETEETVPITQLRETQDKMHQATTEAANNRKLLDEISPFVDWPRYQLSMKGEGVPTAPTSAAPTVSPPSQDLFISDYNKWAEEFKNTLWNEFQQKAIPQVANQATTQTEWARLEGEFTKEVQNAPGGPQRWIYLMNSYINDVRKPNETRTPTQIFEAAKENFTKDFGHVLNMKKPGKKVVPLESPGKPKEQVAAGPEKPMTMQDWDNENRDYVKFRQKRLREMQGG